MEDSNEIVEVEWTAEEIDNGIVLEDTTYSLKKQPL